VLIVDFAVQGTLARQLQDSPQTVTTRDNRPVGGGGWGRVEDKRLVGGGGESACMEAGDLGLQAQ
jgi:hypothetical protein